MVVGFLTWANHDNVALDEKFVVELDIRRDADGKDQALLSVRFIHLDIRYIHAGGFLLKTES